MVAVGTTIDPGVWQAEFDQVLSRVQHRFARVEARQRARALVRKLVSDVPTKNCWTLAEYAGDSSPDGMQHVLRKAVWDADAVRDDVRDLAVKHLGERQAVPVG